MSDKRGIDEGTIYNVSALISNPYLHIFTGKFVRFPPFSNIHVENLKSPRGYFSFSTWASFISSEVSFDSSEEFFIPHVENKNSPRGDFEISTWESLFPDMAPYRYVAENDKTGTRRTRYVPENGKTGTRRTFAKTCC